MTNQTYITPVSARQDCHGLRSPALDCSRPPAQQVCPANYSDNPYTTAVSEEATLALLRNPYYQRPQSVLTPPQVSPFAYPASCEPNLLTPISSASSPPMQHTAKLAQHYTASPTGSGHQQPTPPATTQMYWASTFDVSTTTSQSGSPMPTGPQESTEEQAHFNMAYVTGDPGQDEIPEPPAPYFGHFGVSESRIQTDEDFYPGIGIHPQMMERHSHPQISVHGPSMLHSPLPLHSPQNPHHHHTLPPTPALGPDPTQSPYAPPVYPMQANSPKPPRSKVTEGKVQKKASKPKARQTARPERLEPTDQMQFKPEIPEEERYLLELRMKFKDTKGKTMWDQIGDAFAARFGKKPEKAALQMKLTRAKQRWVIWPAKDEDLLRELYFEDEKERYQRIAGKFNERGGGANLGFNANNIECKLVEMGLEDLWLNPDTKARSRRRPAKERGGRAASGRIEFEVRRQQQPMHSFTTEMTDAQREELYRQVDARTAVDASNTAREDSSTAYQPSMGELQTTAGLQHHVNPINQYYSQHPC